MDVIDAQNDFEKYRIFIIGFIILICVQYFDNYEKYAFETDNFDGSGSVCLIFLDQSTVPVWGFAPESVNTCDFY